MTDWSNVPSRLMRCQARNRERGLIFGAQTHRFEVGPKVRVGEIEAFETRIEARLPESYRDFLQQVGEGGAGPDYGLVSFRGDVSRRNVVGWFPLTETTDWPEDEEDPIWALPGVMYLATAGCGIDWYLEIKGAHPGTMWLNAGPGDCLCREGDFGDWYSAWLEHVEQGLDRFERLEVLFEQGETIEVMARALEKSAYPLTWKGQSCVRFRDTPGRLILDNTGHPVAIDLAAAWLQDA